MVKRDDKFNPPTSLSAAQELWKNNRRDFVLWALSLVDAKPKPKGEDVDGILGFVETGNKKQFILVRATGAPLVPGMMQDLTNATDDEGAAIGLLISLREPNRGLIADSVHAGSYQSELWKRKFLKIQIRTVQELLDGKSFDIPQTYSLVRKKARVKKRGETAQLL